MSSHRGDGLAIVAGFFLLTSFLTTLARCYVRLRIVRAFRLDDALIVAALISYLWMTVSVIIGVVYGTGQHEYDLSPERERDTLQIWWICYLAYAVTMTLAKVSIGLFLLRVTVTRWLRFALIFTISHSILAGVIFFFVVAFQCTPASYFWTMHLPGSHGTCINRETFVSLGYFYGTVCAVGDLTYGLIPIGLVWNLDVNRRTKIALVPVLGMAAIASCAVLVRMAYMPTLADPDFLYATLDIAIWSTVEPGLAITASSLATLRPLFSTMRDRTDSSRQDSRNAIDLRKRASEIIRANDDEFDDSGKAADDQCPGRMDLESGIARDSNKRHTLNMADAERNISCEDLHFDTVSQGESTNTLTRSASHERHSRSVKNSIATDTDTLVGESYCGSTKSPTSPI